MEIPNKPDYKQMEGRIKRRMGKDFDGDTLEGMYGQKSKYTLSALWHRFTTWIFRWGS